MSEMDKKNVTFTAENGLCCSCGVCKNICPQACIRYERRDGVFLPVVDAEKCVKCGLCASVCPGLTSAPATGDKPLDAMYGTILASYNAWSRDEVLRHVSASGGVVSTLVTELLRKGLYDAAFTLDTYSYENQLKTRKITREDLSDSWDQSSFPKSRYLPVSHEEAVRFILENPGRRVILIASPCALRGLQELIRIRRLEREHYLFIGLFCDGVFNYNVYDHYQDRFGEGKQLTALHFKNKESGGWPGNMKLFYAGGSTRYLDKKERAGMKEYFMPERCLYCADKLNICADLSVGDNYTGMDSSPLGSNSVLIRTERGQTAWDAACDSLEFHPFPASALEKAQYLSGRAKRFYYAALKQMKMEKKSGGTSLCDPRLLQDDPRDYERALYYDMQKAKAGARYREEPEKLHNMLDEKAGGKRANPVKSFAERAYFAIKRRIK